MRCLFCKDETDSVGTMFDRDLPCRRCRVAWRTSRGAMRLMVWSKGVDGGGEGDWTLPPSGTLVVGYGGREDPA